MAEVLLLHHALGLTDGVQSLAEELRRAGHTVHAPDLYDGRQFDDIEEGVAHAQQIGMRARGVAVGESLPAELVYVGISAGVMPAQQLAQSRPGAQGVVALESFAAPSWFGSWPGGLRAQIHGMDGDPFFTEEDGDLDAARAFLAEHPDSELFLYPGDHHLFVDPSLPTYDAQAATLVRERVLAFLAAG